MNKQIGGQSYIDPALYEPGGPYEPIAKNYPACKMLFMAVDMERSGNVGGRYWTDRISGVSIPSLTEGILFTYQDWGVSGSFGADNTFIPPIIGDKHLFLVNAGRQGLQNNNIKLGDAGNTMGITLRGNSNGVTRTVNDWGTVPALAVAPYPIDGAICLYIDRANDLAIKYVASEDGTYTDTESTAPSSGTFNGPWGQWEGDAFSIYPTSSSGSKLIALFGFENPPPHPELAMQFMAANPGKLPPWWAGLA